VKNKSNYLAGRIMKQAEREFRKGISDIAGVFTDPIIVHPGGWGENPPARVKEAITIQRLMEEMKSLKGDTPTGTDAEAMWYLSSAAMVAPPGSDWTEIYQYLFTKVAHFQKWDIPQDLAVEDIIDYHRGMMLHLKRWIYDRRVKERQERERVERRAEKKEEADSKAAMCPALFDLSEFTKAAVK
jgi:hypothetical protein